SGQPAAAAWADFNHDGRLDLVIGKSDGSGLSVFLGNANGNGTFSSELLLPVIDSRAVVTADFNNDGKPDIVTISNNTIVLFLGNGDGTFTAAPRVSLASAASTPSLVVGDFNGDGNLDLAAASSAGVWILLGNGDGTFASPSNYGTVSFPTSMAVAD